MKLITYKVNKLIRLFAKRTFTKTTTQPKKRNNTYTNAAINMSEKYVRNQ